MNKRFYPWTLGLGVANFARRALLVVVVLLLSACVAMPAAPTPAPTPIDLAPTFTPLAPEVMTTTPQSAGASEDPAADLATSDAEVLAETAPVSMTTAMTGERVNTASSGAAVTTTLPITELVTPTAVVADEEPIIAITVGVNAELDPFETIDENGNLVGFDIDLMNAIAQVASVEVSYVPMDFDELLPAVAAGELDTAVSAISWTEERAKLVAFTDPYFTSDQSPVSFFGGGLGLAVRSTTTNLQSAADLTADITVGVKSGTTGDTFVIENTTAQIVRYDESPDALLALSQGDVQAVVTDISVIAEFITDNPTLDVQLMGEPLTVEEYVIAVNKDRLDLLELLNASLIRVREDGTYDTLFAKWFQLP